MDIRKRAIEAEQAIIGAVMLSPEIIAETTLRADDFVNDNNREVWKAVLSVSERREPVDLVTIDSELKSRGLQWTTYLSEIIRNCPSAANWKGYQASLIRHGQAARSFEALTDAMRKLRDGEDAIDDLIGRLMGISHRTGSHDWTPKDMINAAYQAIEDRHQGRVKTLSSGIDIIDKILGGFHNSDLIVIAARPAMGKTAVMLNMAEKCGEPVGIFSSEQPKEQVGLRMMSVVGGVRAEGLRNLKMTEAEWDLLGRTFTKIAASGQTYINDSPVMDVADIARQSRIWKQRYGIKAIYCDYIQRFKGGDPRAPKHERVGEIVKGLKSIARELDIPVIALAQVARTVESRSDKRPMMSDISDSSEIEKEADQVVTLYRDEVYDANTNKPGVMEMIICKNRHGATGLAKVGWRGATMQIFDVEQE